MEDGGRSQAYGQRQEVTILPTLPYPYLLQVWPALPLRCAPQPGVPADHHDHFPPRIRFLHGSSPQPLCGAQDKVIYTEMNVFRILVSQYLYG